MTPRWVRLGTLVLSLAALAVSTYLSVAHLTTAKILACSGSGTIDCTRVTTSAQSRALGIPVAFLGLAWSVAMVALCTPSAWRSRVPSIRFARLVLAGSGMLFVLWLVYAELFVIRAICLWCTVIHVLTFALFVLIVVFGWADDDRDAVEPAGARR
jgi:uncharacterized membrane protein